MANKPELKLFQRKSLDQITDVPESIIDVYVLEKHTWASKGTEEEQLEARKNRQAETQTIEEFLIDPVRPFLTDFFRQLSAPYDPHRRDNPIGQGYWIQAEFGSGKSHLLSFIGALALGGKEEWNLIKEKEEKAGKGKRESLYHFYESGLEKKSTQSKGIFVAVKTLVGQGSSEGPASEKTLADYILDAVADQYFQENGRSLPLYPTEILAERFLNNDLEIYGRQLEKFLKDPRFFDEEEQQSLADFLQDLQNNQELGVQRDCGQRLWDFYRQYLKVTPDIPVDPEPKLKHMVDRLLAEGYAGLLVILDEVSLFLQNRTAEQRVEDEKALIVLSNRLAKNDGLPVWTVCAAQQAIMPLLVGWGNIIADDRLKLVPLLNRKEDYYGIALARVREITQPGAIDAYYEDYKRSFSWPAESGQDEFARFFPFYKPAIDVVRAVSYNLTTMRSALHFMLQTLKTQRKKRSNEIVALWQLFDDVVSYEEDPSGTPHSIANLKTKFPVEWKAFEEARRQIDGEKSGSLKAYRSRCEKIVKTLFLYHVANLAPEGLTAEEIMNHVMEWKDHDKGQRSDLQDNKDHYEILINKLNLELIQIEKAGTRYRFRPAGGEFDPNAIFQRTRAEVEGNQKLQDDAWKDLLKLDGWEIRSGSLTMDLASGIESVFRQIAPESQKDVPLIWHNREITGRVFMRDLHDIAHNHKPLPSINSPDTGLDYFVFISHKPVGDELTRLVKDKADPRILFWSPDSLTPDEKSLLIDFTAYREMVKDSQGRETEKARLILEWIQGRLSAQMGTIYRIVPDSYGRGRITSLGHSAMNFTCQGELTSILTSLVEQVLDAVYACKDMIFDAQVPFSDTNAMNVINGIVKANEFPRGVKPSKEVSASQNFGFTLGIMRRPNDHKLDLRDCRYTKDLMDWIEEKLGDNGTNIGATTIYKNFMGINGPNEVSYGLSKRMVQLYLLCLAREGRLRITLSGRNMPVEAIDYTNIAHIEFRTAVLDGFDQIQRLKPPEGWEVLAPFAAILLDDESIRNVREDADIQTAVQRILKYRADNLPVVRELHQGLDALFQEIGQPNPASDRLAAWASFLSSPVDSVDPIPGLRYGLHKAFDYPVYPDDNVRQEDLDDMATRRNEVDQANRFITHQEKIRAAVRYLAVQLSDDPALTDLKRKLDACRSRLTHFSEWVSSESKLTSEFLTPMAEAIEMYRVRYLQALDTVIARTEQVRQQLAELDKTPAFLALAVLGAVRALGDDFSESIRRSFQAAADAPDLFPAEVTRASVERNLPYWPQPAGCPLTLDNAADWVRQAETVLAGQERAPRDALLDKARLLASPALRTRLEQGKHEPFIAGLLDCPSPEALADLLCEELNQPDAQEKVQTLARYLKRITVKKVSLSDFHPTKRTFEFDDVGQVAAEFAVFLQAQFTGDDPDELQIVELA